MNVPRQIPFVASATALALALTVARPLAAPPDVVVPPPVPGTLEAPSGHTAFLIGRAYGTQSYSCLPSQGVIKWLPAGPQATVFDADGKQILTHYLSPNPEESGTPRATWQHSRDTSAVWASALVETYAEPDFVAPGAVPWLRIAVGGRRYGPAWGDKLIPATYIQRVNTVGGIAPATGCVLVEDIGKRVFMPYVADYVFYKQDGAGR